MNIKSIRPAEWKEYASGLQKNLPKNFWISRIVRVDEKTVALEGGKIPATFSLDKEELQIWSRASKYAGASVTIAELTEVEEVCKKWVSELKKKKVI